MIDAKELAGFAGVSEARAALALEVLDEMGLAVVDGPDGMRLMRSASGSVAASCLTLNSYQVEAHGTSMSTTVYMVSGNGQLTACPWVYPALGLGEAGEVQGKIKKLLRDKGGVLDAEDKAAVVGELGDVLWYVAEMATQLGVSLADVANANLKKLASRKARGKITGSGDSR